MQGIPEGYEVIGFKCPEEGESYLDVDGSVVVAEYDVVTMHVVVLKLESPIPDGVFAPGWVAYDESNEINYWYGRKPTFDADTEEFAPDGGDYEELPDCIRINWGDRKPEHKIARVK